MAKLTTNDYKITINGTNFSDHLAGITLSATVTEQPSTAFGMGWSETTTGVKSATVALSFHQDYGASSVDATLFPLLGSNATVVAAPTSGSVSATNPAYTAVCKVTQYSPIAGNFDSLASFDVTWPVNGTVTRGTA
jgi:hypothetical protein